MRGYGIGFLFVLMGFGAAQVWSQQPTGDSQQGPSDTKAQKTFAEAKEWLSHRDEHAAIDDFRKADKQDGGHCEACRREVIRLGFRNEDMKAVEAAAQEEVEDAKTPQQTAMAHETLGRAKYREGILHPDADKFAAADREFKAALAAYQQFPAAHFEDGMALARLNQDDAAKTQFEMYLTIAPKDDTDIERARHFLVRPELARARMAPPFRVTTMDGRQMSLDSLEGKVVLIDFWATWCGPCREALPHIRQIAQKFGDQPLVVLSVSLDSDEGKWKDFVAKNQMTWLQYRDTRDADSLATKFQVHAIPHTFTIDADGVLQEERVGDDAIEGKLKKLCTQARDKQQKAVAAASPAGGATM